MELFVPKREEAWLRLLEATVEFSLLPAFLVYIRDGLRRVEAEIIGTDSYDRTVLTMELDYLERHTVGGYRFQFPEVRERAY